MARTANVFARVEPELKEQAEDILQQLGSLQSDVDDSPKVEFKQKKYL